MIMPKVDNRKTNGALEAILMLRFSLGGGDAGANMSKKISAEQIMKELAAIAFMRAHGSLQRTP